MPDNNYSRMLEAMSAAHWERVDAILHSFELTAEEAIAVLAVWLSRPDDIPRWILIRLITRVRISRHVEVNAATMICTRSDGHPGPCNGLPRINCPQHKG